MNAGLTSTATPRVNEDFAPIQHWVIAHAVQEAATLHKSVEDALASLYLPNLQKLFSQMACVSKFTPSDAAPLDFLMPHEVAPQIMGAKPTLGKEALMTPCHWQVGMNDVVLLQPEELALNETESRQLLSAMQPYFQEDGLAVVYESPLIWRVSADLLEGLPLASIDRVIGQSIKAWMPEHQHAKKLQRLQSEMQMLLYQHPVNDERSFNGRWTVNSFWLHRNLEQLYPNPSEFAVVTDLRNTDLSSNLKLWQQAWEHIDATLGASLCQALDHPQSVSLTLCSNTSWRHYRPQPATWRNKLQRWLKPVSVNKELHALSSGVSAS